MAEPVQGLNEGYPSEWQAYACAPDYLFLAHSEEVAALGQ